MWGGCLFHPPAFASCQKVFDCMTGTFNFTVSKILVWLFFFVHLRRHDRFLGRTGSGSELQRFITTVSACRSTKIFNEMIERICDSRSLGDSFKASVVVAVFVASCTWIEYFLTKGFGRCKKRTEFTPCFSLQAKNDAWTQQLMRHAQWPGLIVRGPIQKFRLFISFRGEEGLIS